MPEAVISDGTDARQQLEQRVKAHPYWYHRIELPHGVVTPGWAPLSVNAYRIPADLSGKRVLDIGAWDGFWSFEALKRGAKEVLAIDDFSDHLGYLEKDHRSAWDTFDLCRDALGYDESRCQRKELSVYDLNPETVGRFDVVFFFGTIYHLRHPLLALDKIASVCQNDLYVESAILDDYSPYRGGLGKGYRDGQFVAEFYPTTEYGGNLTNWWVPTVHCLGAMVFAAGFPHVQGWRLTDNPGELAHCRGFVHGRKTVDAPLSSQPASTEQPQAESTIG